MSQTEKMVKTAVESMDATFVANLRELFSEVDVDNAGVLNRCVSGVLNGCVSLFVYNLWGEAARGIQRVGRAHDMYSQKDLQSIMCHFSGRVYGVLLKTGHYHTLARAAWRDLLSSFKHKARGHVFLRDVGHVIMFFFVL